MRLAAQTRGFADGWRHSPRIPVSYLAHGSRQTSLTYPNTRVLHYVYATGVHDTICRLSYLPAARPVDKVKLTPNEQEKGLNRKRV